MQPAGLTALLCLAGALAGLTAGMGVAAGGLALAGRALFEMAPDQAEVALVVAPLAGLGPVVALALAAAARPLVARRAPAALACWLGAALLATYWLGLRPLFH